MENRDIIQILEKAKRSKVPAEFPWPEIVIVTGLVGAASVWVLLRLTESGKLDQVYKWLGSW